MWWAVKILVTLWPVFSVNRQNILDDMVILLILCPSNQPKDLKIQISPDPPNIIGGGQSFNFYDFLQFFYVCTFSASKTTLYFFAT